MKKLTLLFICLYLIGCKQSSNNVSRNEEPAGLQETQEILFHKINHEEIYKSCQNLIQNLKEGKLSTNAYYCDDTNEKLQELPENIRSLKFTYVHISEMMVEISFDYGEDGSQLLICPESELGSFTPTDENSKGLGFRKDPFAMDRLTGNESLEYLNSNYNHFQIELIPGLSYAKYPKDENSPNSIDEMKQDNLEMDMMLEFMNQTIDELAVKTQRMLYKTDQKELLQACRDAIKLFNEGKFSTDKINIDPFQLQPSQDIKLIPEIILNLEPVYVWFRKDYVMVALMGGLGHAGVIAYKEGSEQFASDDSFQVIDGLWYYDDGLREADDDYIDYIKSLENEAVTYGEWKRKQMN